MDSSKDEIGFAKAFIDLLILHTGTHTKSIKSIKSDVDYSDIIIDFEVILLQIIVYENGKIDLHLQQHEAWWYSSNFSYVNMCKSGSVMDPIFDPYVVVEKLSKIFLFLKSIKQYMANADIDWLIHGIRSIICGSNIITKKEKYKYIQTNFRDTFFNTSLQTLP